MTVATRRRPIKLDVRYRVLSDAGFRCRYCGRAAPDAVLQVDHVISLADGGTDDRANLVASCTACNLGKGAKSVHQPIWFPVRPERGVNLGGRCPDEWHIGPYVECDYPIDRPALALSCEACRYIVAWRPLP